MSATCATLARDLDEPLAGTGPTTPGWVLLERPGAWGRDALAPPTLSAPVLATLAGRLAGAPVKGLAIRRTRRPRADGASPHPDASTERTVLLAHTGPDAWCERLTIRDDRDLLDLDPAVCADPTPPGIGVAHHDPVLLVCTHGKRDRCCATLGRPIADTLSALHPELTWESSHLGGHRFAGNLLVLPDGWCYGGLDVTSATEVVANHLAGRVSPTRLRGRAGIDRAAQAAEVFVRRARAADDVDEVRVTSCRTDPAVGDGDDHLVTVEVADERVEVRVRWQPSGEARTLSCDADDPEDPGGYHPVSIRPIGDDRVGGDQGRPTPATQLRWSAP